MSPSYTHEYKFELGEFELEGDVEFNVDGQASYITKDPLPNITIRQQQKITQLFALLREIFVEFEAIDLMEIQVKEE